MANDRLGIRWGLAGGTTLATIDAARAAAEFADAAGFDSFWISNAMAVGPIVALAAIGTSAPSLSELGTSVVPLFGRHPVVLAQQALTAQSALDNRFTLGIGAGSKSQAEGRLGLSWDKPFSFTREFFEALDPLLTGQPARLEPAQQRRREEVPRSGSDRHFRLREFARPGACVVGEDWRNAARIGEAALPPCLLHFATGARS